MPPKRPTKSADEAKAAEKKPKLEAFAAGRRQSARTSTARAQALIKQQTQPSSDEEDVEDSDDDFEPVSDGDSKSRGVVVQPVNSFLSSASSSSGEDEEEEKPQPKKKKSVKKPAAAKPSTSKPVQEKPEPKKSSRSVLSSDSDSDLEAVPVPAKPVQPVHVVTDSDSADEMQEVETNLHELFPLLTQQKELAALKDAPEKEKDKKGASKSATLDVSQLLAMGETQQPVASSSKAKSKPSSKKKSRARDSDESDFEEVELGALHEIPKEGVEVNIEGPENMRKKKTKTLDVEAVIKRRINQIRREKQVELHKASLLCHLSHGMIVNRTLNSPSVMAVALSILPSQHCYPPKQTDLNYVEKIVNWFKKKVPVANTEEDKDSSLVQLLEKSFTDMKAPSKRLLVFMFVAMLRALGVKTRLIISLQPLPLKPGSVDLLTVSAKAEPKEEKKEKPAAKKSEPQKEAKGSKPKKEDKPSKSKKEEKSTKVKPEKAAPAKESKSKQPARKSEAPKPVSKRPKKEKESKYFSEGNNSSSSPDVAQKLKALRTRKTSKYKEESSEDSDHNPSPSKKRRSTPKTEDYLERDSDDDFKPQVLKVVKNSKIKVEDRRVLSSDPERSNSPKNVKAAKNKVGNDYWVEVFVEMEEKWISVDVINGKVHCVEHLYAKASTPVLYVMGFGHDQSVRDVTRRYCSQYHTTTRKQRVDQDWWDEATKPFFGKKSAYDKEEEEQMNRQLQDRPVPKTLSELKNHPLYCLKRHLLKFEGIYPPDAPPLGWFKDEPIYARECVFTLRSRETWVKEARVVKPNEQPYKIVKARPKYDRMSGLMVDAPPLEIFGPWQTQDYEPPVAQDGKVPRNEYGNVELFKACMLPKGTVHLQISTLNRVAKKLGIDCAPAMVGFDYHCGGCHPVFDGFVVCEEYKDTLIDAHRQEEEERVKREEEKRLKRIYGNWRKLINGLLIREKLMKKYDFSQDGGKGKKKAAQSGEASTSKTAPKAAKPKEKKVGQKGS